MRNKPLTKRLARSSGLIIGCLVLSSATLILVGVLAARPSQTQDQASHPPTLVLPDSPFLSQETRTALQHVQNFVEEDAAILKQCPSEDGADRATMPGIRRCQAEAFYKTAQYKEFREQYHVSISSRMIGGIYAEVFTPTEGIPDKNADRVLINLHGGGFVTGSRTYSQVESIPVASMGRIKVISVDYRMAPEFTFPSASEDVAAVYREVLKSYKPKNIGVFGCSAGGLLTAQTMAWLQKQRLPLPGAIGMLCEGASYWSEGDSGQWTAATSGHALEAARDNPYLKDANSNDALAFPTRSREVIAKFPPSLLVSSSRDLALSSVIYTHTQLVQQGVEAELHVWEGLGHAFFYYPNLPESKEVYRVIVQFFDRHLGQEPKSKL